MRFPGLSSPAAPAEIYASAFAAAHDVVSRRPIRQNNMRVHGALALRLAQVGSMIVPTSYGSRMGLSYFDPLSPVPDYISEGARASFDLLEQAFTPAAKRVGLGNFMISACDATGRILPKKAVLLDDTLARAVGSFHYTLGEDRRDFYSAAASGIAAKVTPGSGSLRKAKRYAQDLAGESSYDNAVAALSGAAELGFQVVSRTLAADPEAQTIPSLYVRVSPGEGVALADKSGELFKAPITIYAPANS